MKPQIWGRHFWTTIHLIALGYPDVPTIEDQQTYRDFFNMFGRILPCYKCSVNYVRHVSEMPIDTYLKNPQTLFNWTVSLHNVVNRELGKPVWNVEYARMHYLNLGTPRPGHGDAWYVPYLMGGLVSINVIVLVCIVMFLIKNVRGR